MKYFISLAIALCLIAGTVYAAAPSRTDITQEGAFDGTIRGQVNTNFTDLYARTPVDIAICGDGTTINNNTIYYGPSLDPVAGSGRVCDVTQAGNATEGTADAPGLQNTAFYVLGMDCLTDDPGASGVSFTLRNNAAATVPSVTCSVANTELGCTSSVKTTTVIAAGAPISIAAASAGNQGTTQFSCIVHAFY